MKNTTTLETDNLVLFPAAKNFAAETDLAELDDPMMDLLNEFSHVSDADLPDYIDDRFELEQESENSSQIVYESLEAFMQRNRNDSAELNMNPVQNDLLNDKMQEILEAKAKIKFYLDEIDMFLPRRR